MRKRVAILAVCGAIVVVLLEAHSLRDVDLQRTHTPVSGEVSVQTTTAPSTTSADAPTQVADSATTTIDTSDWVTCENSRAKYVFKYPPTWNVYAFGGVSVKPQRLSSDVAATTTCSQFTHTFSVSPPGSLYPPESVRIIVEMWPVEDFDGPALRPLPPSDKLLSGPRLDLPLGNTSFVAFAPNPEDSRFSTILVSGRYDNLPSVYRIYVSPSVSTATLRAILSTFRFLPR